MPKFQSPLGNKEFNSPSMKEIDIPDDSEYVQPIINRGANVPFDVNAMRDFQARMQPSVHQEKDFNEIERDIKEAKMAKRQGKERLSDGARRRIEMLVGMTRLNRSVDIDGNIYMLQTLKSKELRDAIVASVEFDGTVQFSFENAKQILARSLIQVAGLNIEEFINSNELEDKLYFIENLDQSLLMRLFSEYNLLNKESQEKYSIKNTEDAKEIVEDLKK